MYIIYNIITCQKIISFRQRWKIICWLKFQWGNESRFRPLKCTFGDEIECPRKIYPLGTKRRPIVFLVRGSSMAASRITLILASKRFFEYALCWGDLSDYGGVASIYVWCFSHGREAGSSASTARQGSVVASKLGSISAQFWCWCSLWWTELPLLRLFEHHRLFPLKEFSSWKAPWLVSMFG